MIEDGRLVQRNGRTTVFLREETGPARQKFTLAHELGHLLLAEPNEDMEACRMPPVHFDSEERFCDQFAAALLLPKGWIESEFAKAEPSLGIARNVSSHSGVSLSASMLRLREVLGWQSSLLHWRRYQSAWRLVSTVGLPSPLHNQVISNEQTRAVLSSLAGSEQDLRGMLPLIVRGRNCQVPVEISAGLHGAVAMAAFLEAVHDPPSRA
ncbi:MAG TPA: ImmA/IrrE family metallo-endopeptidase [Solirubrobacterales bacterium]|nr:ImmA/IrrE family metallo-endopeptidase [Solirubrobacterales bacterium]